MLALGTMKQSVGVTSLTHKSDCNITDHFDPFHDGYLLYYMHWSVILNDWLDSCYDQLVILINLFCEYLFRLP